MQQMIFIADFIACSTCFGAPLCPLSGAREYYTDGRCLWYLVFGFKLSVWCGAEGYVSGLQPANRTHNPVGILFPHIWQYCLLATARSLYMFRTLSAPIIWST